MRAESGADTLECGWADVVADMGVMVEEGEGGITRLGRRGGSPVRGATAADDVVDAEAVADGTLVGCGFGGGHVDVVAELADAAAEGGRAIGFPELAVGGALDLALGPAAALKASLDALERLVASSLGVVAEAGETLRLEAGGGGADAA